MKKKFFLIFGLIVFAIFQIGAKRSVVNDFVLVGKVTNGQFVGKVIASDPDNATNPAKQTLSFAIVSGNLYSTFRIDSYTGILTVGNKFAINWKVKRGFDLGVRVTDNGAPPKSAQANVHITVVR